MDSDLPSALRIAIEVAYDVTDVNVDVGYSNPVRPDDPQGVQEMLAAVDDFDFGDMSSK